MTAATSTTPTRRALLAQVHLAKKELGLDDDTYRDMLRTSTGQDSSAALTIPELERLLARMRTLGWQRGKPVQRFRPSEKLHVRKVWALWGAMRQQKLLENASREALRTFVSRMTQVTDPEWLSPAQAIQVIEGLKAWKARLEQQREHHDRDGKVTSDS